MTEKSDMEDLFTNFEQLPQLEDTVNLDDIPEPMEDDYFEQPEEAPEYPTYGEVAELKWPEYTFKTSGGKTIQVKHDKVGTLWSISFKEGGQLPSELTGKFTSEHDACKQVEVYLARQ